MRIWNWRWSKFVIPCLWPSTTSDSEGTKDCVEACNTVRSSVYCQWFNSTQYSEFGVLEVGPKSLVLDWIQWSFAPMILTISTSNLKSTCSWNLGFFSSCRTCSSSVFLVNLNGLCLPHSLFAIQILFNSRSRRIRKDIKMIWETPLKRHNFGLLFAGIIQCLSWILMDCIDFKFMMIQEISLVAYSRSM